MLSKYINCAYDLHDHHFILVLDPQCIWLCRNWWVNRLLPPTI